MGGLLICFVVCIVLFKIISRVINRLKIKKKHKITGPKEYLIKKSIIEDINKGVKEEHLSPAVEEYMEEIWAEAWPHEGGQLNVHDLSAGFAYNLFGLPDGTYAPKNILAAPGPNTLQRALQKVIIPMLKKNEKILLDTPFEFARVPFIDAAHVFDERGKHWIVLNHTLFGALYSVNDRFMEILEVNSGLRVVDDPIKLACQFTDLICRFVLGERVGDGKWLVRMTTRMDPDLCHIIGTYTSVQQIFFVLHELGHAFLSHGVEKAIPFSTNLSVWRSRDSTSEFEKSADSFAADHIRKGPLPERIAENPEACVIGLFLLFECLELLRKLGKYSPGSHTLPRKRFKHLAQSIDSKSYKKLNNTLSNQQSLFDDVYTVWKLNQA